MAGEQALRGEKKMQRLGSNSCKQCAKIREGSPIEKIYERYSDVKKNVCATQRRT